MRFLAGALERLSLDLRLVLGFSLVLLITVAVGGEGIFGHRVLKDSLTHVQSQDLPAITAGKDAQVAFATIGRALRQAALAPDEAARRQALAQLDVARARLSTNIESLRPASRVEDSDFAQFEQAFSLYRLEVDRVIDLLNTGKSAEALPLLASAKFQEVAVSVHDLLHKIVSTRNSEVDQRIGVAVDAARRSEARSAVFIVLGLLVSALVGVSISRSVRTPLQRLQVAVEQLAQGNLKQEVPHQDHATEIGALARAVAVLGQEAQQMETQRWLKSNLANVSTELQSATCFAELSDRLFSRVAPLLNLGLGLFYVFDGKELRLIGGYACGSSSNLEQRYALGEGLVGQCAAERRQITLGELPVDYMQIGSALGQSSPVALNLVPVVMANDQVLGVLELASFDAFPANALALLESLVPILATSIELLERKAQQQARQKEIERANFLADIALELTESGYWHVDYSDPDYYYQSERAARILGEPIKPDGRYHLADEWFARLLEADIEAANLTSERYQGAIDGRYDHYDATYAYKRPLDGKIVWVRANGKVVRDPQTDKITFMYGAYQDITERKRAQDELLEATRGTGEGAASKVEPEPPIRHAETTD